MKILFSLVFLALSYIASATDYFVKNGGNDLASGTSDASAWATIEKVNSVFASLNPGDKIFFRKGDTFYGTINITRSGVAGSPITLGAYGTGEKPVITGLTTLTSWTSEGNGIYSTALVSEAQTNMVIVDGNQYAMGRWPDASYNIFESASSNISITDNELTAATDWTGAEVVIRKNDWTLDRCKITDHTGTKLTYTSLATTQDAIPGHGYFIQNDLRTLSKFGEWYHAHNAGRLYMYFGTASPSGKTIKVATLNTLVYTTEYDYITINDLHLTGSISNVITCLNYISNYWTISNSIIDFAGQDGIHLLGHNSNINNNYISNCNQLGIRAVGNNETITSNTIRNIGIIPGQAPRGTYTSGIFITNDNCIIKYNTIENIGYCGINLSSTTDVITIQNNFINNVMLTLNDGAAIYVVAEGISRKIDGNIIMNVIGNTSGTPFPDRHIARGIYLDVNTTKTTITNNTVANCTEAGYMIHRSSDNVFENNTSFNNGYGIFFQNSSGSVIRNNTLKNNIFFAKDASQLALKFYSGTDDIPSFGTANNNVYARPVDDDDVFYTYSPSTGGKYRTLAGWQSFTGKDLTSKKSPIAISDTSKIDFYYNAATSNKVITLSKPMIDVKGTKYAGSVTLLPYTSLILMPDPNPGSSTQTNQAPVVTIASPTKGSVYTSPATIVFDVEAYDHDGSIKSVALYNGTLKLGELTMSPYSFTIKNLEEGSYSLHAVATDNLNSATTSASLEFKVNSLDIKNETFNLYPNPNDGRFSIEFSSVLDTELFTLTVYNIIGKTVFQTEWSTEDNLRQFDLSQLDPGIYIVMISADKILLTQKFIKG